MTEEKPKRKTHTSTYGAVTAYVPKELAAAFKAKCADQGVSQAAIIKAAIERFLAE